MAKNILCVLFFVQREQSFFEFFLIDFSLGYLVQTFSPEVTKRASPKMMIAVRSVETILDIAFVKTAKSTLLRSSWKKSFLENHDVRKQFVLSSYQDGRFGTADAKRVQYGTEEPTPSLPREHSSSSPSHIFYLFPTVCLLDRYEIFLFRLMRDSFLKYIKFMT